MLGVCGKRENWRCGRNSRLTTPLYLTGTGAKIAKEEGPRYFAAFASAPRIARRMFPLMMPWISSVV
ncbi:MAG: hypothetical protein JWP89_3277 [Schlesneria sp.]|nr:hypothetical protein [Schlesneria sp.]